MKSFIPYFTPKSRIDGAETPQTAILLKLTFQFQNTFFFSTTNRTKIKIWSSIGEKRVFLPQITDK